MSLGSPVLTLSILLGMFSLGLHAQEAPRSTPPEAPAEKAVVSSLVYALDTGDILRYQITSEWSQSVTETGTEPKGTEQTGRRLEHTTVEEWVVRDVDAKGNRTIQITIREVSVQDRTGDELHSFEAKDLEDEARRTELALQPELAVSVAMRGQSLTIRITSAGSVLSVEGGEAIRAQVIGALESIGIDKALATSRVAGTLSDDAIADRLTRILAVGPESGDGVELGQEWSRNFSRSLGSLGGLDEVARFKLTAREGASAELEVRSRMEFRPRKGNDSKAELAVEIEVGSGGASGGREVFGTATFDLERGCLQRSRTELSMTLTAFRKRGRMQHRQVVRSRESRRVELVDFQKAGKDSSGDKSDKK